MICFQFYKVSFLTISWSYSLITNIACKYFPPPSIYLMMEIRKQLHFTCNNGLTMRQNDICFHGRKFKRAPKAQKASRHYLFNQIDNKLFSWSHTTSPHPRNFFSMVGHNRLMVLMLVFSNWSKECTVPD